MPCKFNRAWIGPCGEATAGNFCEEHTTKKCVSCGAQATKECPNSSSLVCGAELCGSCFHEPYNKAGFCYGKDGRHGKTCH